MALIYYPGDEFWGTTMRKGFWNKILIALVLLLSVYNILPTIFFYCKPLKDPINKHQANYIEKSILNRMHALEKNTLDWLFAFCKTLKVDPTSIKIDEDAPHQIVLKFKNTHDTSMFMKHLPQANLWIPFSPQSLFVKESSDPIQRRVVLERKTFFDFSKVNEGDLFSFVKKESQQDISMEYQSLIMDQIAPVKKAFQKRTLLQNILSSTDFVSGDSLAPVIVNFCQKTATLLEQKTCSPDIEKRYFNSIFSPLSNSSLAYQRLTKEVKDFCERNKLERISLQAEEQKKKENHEMLSDQKREQLERTAVLKNISQKTLTFLQKHSPKNSENSFSIKQSPQSSANAEIGTVEIPIYFHPYVKSLRVNLKEGLLDVDLYEDLLFQNQEKSDTVWINHHAAHEVHQELTTIMQKNCENIKSTLQGFQIQLHTNSDTRAFLVMNMAPIAQSKLQQVRNFLEKEWKPQSKNLSNNNCPVYDLPTYLNKPPEEQKVGFVLYSSAIHSKWENYSFKPSSFYLIAKGLPWIAKNLSHSPQSEEASLLRKDIERLRNFLHTIGFFGYSGATLSNDKDFWEDIIFENEDYLDPFLAATRENFRTPGSGKYAILEFSDLENRILTENRIAEQEHAELLKWRDDYQSAQLHLGNKNPLDVPPPTRSPFWNNLCLNAYKYFHGDDHRILHWGLDLSGGKSVLLELYHLDGSLVTSHEDLQKGIDDLYKRVNKLGISEIDIRQEGTRISIDFPRAPGMTTENLLKASTLKFHLINEKFSPKNQVLADHVSNFLRDIWGEALACGKTDRHSLNAIAWSHIYGNSTDMNVIQPKSESARVLYENGLRLAPLSGPLSESRETFSDMFSVIQLIKQDSKLSKQEVPLLITFQNYALEGSSLSNIRGSYDPSRGHTLSFEVKKKRNLSPEETFYPQENLYTWTSQFSKEKISGTPLSLYSRGEGWRMAVVLNDQIITAPTLSSAIKSAGSIEGNFSQRELQHLEMDLKAGSFTFVPHILSEKNVSADMGSHEWTLGFAAFSMSLLFVILTMLYVYRFGGVIASFAVACNLLIMWAILQNIGATLTFASIAGIILSVGMAVDANVLVFERIREELTQGKKLAEAIRVGYKKALTAIMDSNITTILSCIILLQFDSGPIKGFALTLLVGIASSMFTSLFMTRCFFMEWIKNPKNTQLNMVVLPSSWNINFLKGTKPVLFLSSLIVLVGVFTASTHLHDVIGIDFTGGYSMALEFPHQNSTNAKPILRQDIITALTNTHINEQNIQVRELGSPNQFRVFLSKNVTNDIDQSLEQLPDSILIALKKSNLPITSEVEEGVRNNWCEISGKLSQGMYQAALYGLILSLALIFFYVMARFGFTYALSAVLCLIHDLSIALSFIAIGNYLGIHVQLDLGTVAALMTIIGYSLNDTIVIFDRIREENDTKKGKKILPSTVNSAISSTLSRTLITSGTTLVALIPLVFLGNHAILGFSLVMISGVVFGTLSSIFVAAPLATRMNP